MRGQNGVAVMMENNENAAGKAKNIMVRPMTRSDLEQVTEIENKCFSIPWSYNSFLDACETEYNVYLVCELDGKIAGYCGLWTVLGEGNITNMAVSPDYRKQGIGELLMCKMEEAAKEQAVNTFFLEVRQSNEPAINLYKKMGYEQIGIRKRFYERPVEDAIVMSKMYSAAI